VSLRKGRWARVARSVCFWSIQVPIELRICGARLCRAFLRPACGLRLPRPAMGEEWAGWNAGIITDFSPVRFSCYLVFSTTWPASFFGSFFWPSNVFNNFSALFLGLFGFVFQHRSFVFNNFSALFFKNKIILSHTILLPK
jgi:hypothetical protein